MTPAEQFSEERRLAFLAHDLRRYQARCATFAPYTPPAMRHAATTNTRTTRAGTLPELLARLEERAA